MNIKMKRKLSIFQYGSQFDPTGPTRYSPSDWIQISISESSPSEGSCSIGAPPVSNSSASEASTGIRDELPIDLNMTDMSEEFRNVCLFFKGKIEYIGADLPSTWTLEGFTQLVLGEEDIGNINPNPGQEEAKGIATPPSSTYEPSGLEQREEELLKEALTARKADLAQGEKISEVREAIENDFNVFKNVDKFQLIQKIKAGASFTIPKSEITSSALNEIKDFQSA